MVRSTTQEGRRGGSLRRQYAAAAVVFATLVLAIILTFGHLIAGSLSRRYLEDVLLSGRDELTEIAGEMTAENEQDTNLFLVYENRREALVRRAAGLAERQLYKSVVVYDERGQEVMQIDLRSSERLPEPIVSELELSGSLQDQVTETDTSYQIAAPLGDLGEIVLNVSKGRLAERVTRLRSQLLYQTFAVAGLTLMTLVGAFAFVWHVIQRNQRLEAKRREAEEMAALGTLAAHLAHEIRNPLNSLNLNLELLEEDIGAGGEQAETSLASTRKEVGRLAQLVSDFLTYARPTQLQRDVMQAEDLLVGVAEFLRAEAQARGVHLRVRAVERCWVSGDTAQLRQVLMNLTLNAVQAVEELTPDRRVVDLAAEANGHQVTLVVRDRGEGIPTEELQRVLEAFYTRRRGGTGLGLAIAERIARAHGGQLELINLEQQGFEARVILPAPRDDGNMEPSRATGSSEVARRTE